LQRTDNRYKALQAQVMRTIVFTGLITKESISTGDMLFIKLRVLYQWHN